MRWPVILAVAFMIVTIGLVLYARVRLLSMPLERDEGEYAYIGQLMLQGVPPYAEAANMKLPGTDAAYALIMSIFGQTIVGIHVGFLLVNAGAIMLVYFLAKRFFGPVGGVAAAASYAILSVGQDVLGMWAHATHFVVLPAMGATLLLFRWAESRKTWLLAASGLLFGTAFLMKQPGILFAVFGLLYIIFALRDELRSNLLPLLRDVAVFGASTAAPFGLTCFLLWRAGVFPRFWLWAFTYARYYVSITSLSKILSMFGLTALPILWTNLGLILVAAAGLVVLWLDAEHRNTAIVITGFLVCSCLAVCPGFYFRQHYYILAFPAFALLVGALASRAKPSAAGSVPLVLIALALGYSLRSQVNYLFLWDPFSISRGAYLTSPFPEAIPVADYIREHTKPEDRIEVLGSEPEIYFYAHRKSVTPYVYIFPLMEEQPLAPAMQTEYIEDVETRKPEYFVLVNCTSSWARQEKSTTRILDWAVPYLGAHYDVVGVVDMFQGGAVYQWGPAAQTYTRKSNEFLIVLRRKQGGA